MANKYVNRFDKLAGQIVDRMDPGEIGVPKTFVVTGINQLRDRIQDQPEKMKESLCQVMSYFAYVFNMDVIVDGEKLELEGGAKNGD